MCHHQQQQQSQQHGERSSQESSFRAQQIVDLHGVLHSSSMTPLPQTPGEPDTYSSMLDFFFSTPPDLFIPPTVGTDAARAAEKSATLFFPPHNEVRRCFHCTTAKTSLWRLHNGESLWNACGLFIKCHGTARPSKLARDLPLLTRWKRNIDVPLVCTNCDSTTTPAWRRGPEGALLCNACGLHLRIHREHRPMDLRPLRISWQRRKGEKVHAIELVMTATSPLLFFSPPSQ